MSKKKRKTEGIRESRAVAAEPLPSLDAAAPVNGPSSRFVAVVRAAPLAIMGLATVANLAAFWSNRIFANLGIDPLALLLPLLGLICCWRRGDRDIPREAAWWLLGALAFLGLYLVTDLLQADLPPVAWGHFIGRCLLVCSAALVLWAPIRCETGLRLGAIGGGVAAVAFAAPHAPDLLAGRITAFEQMETGGLVFGNVSWLVNLAAPGILGWMAWRTAGLDGRRRAWALPSLAAGAVLVAVAMIQSRGLGLSLIPHSAAVAIIGGVVIVSAWLWSQGGLPRLVEAGVPLLGFASLALVGIATGRRGFAIALVLVLAVVAFDRLRCWRPRLAWCFAGAAALALIGLFAYAFVFTDTHRHGDRFILYRAALESAAHSFPWGQGGYASLNFHGLAPDYGEYMTAWMKMCDHVHNEFLEVLLHLGVPGVLTALALLGSAAWWSFRIADARLRLGCQVLCAALLVPACTDNSLATTAGNVLVGAALGLVLKAAAPGGGAFAQTGSPAWPRASAALTGGLRAILVPAALACAWMAWHTLPVMGIDKRGTTADALASAIASSKDIYAVKGLANIGMSVSAQGRNPQMGRQTIRAVEQALGDAPWGLEPYNFVLDFGDRSEAAEASIRCLTNYPFEDRFYDVLEKARVREPLINSTIPAPIARRLDVLYHPDRGVVIDLARAPLTVADAADQYIALRALYARGGDWSLVVPAVERLLARYRLIPNLTKLALEAVVYAPADAAEGIGERIAALPLVAPAPQAMAAFLAAAVTTPTVARRMPPLLEKLFPQELAQGRRKAAEPASSPDQAGDLPAAIARVLRLAESAPQDAAKN